VPGALWAAFAGAGRHSVAVGRVVMVPSVADALARGLEAGARRLKVGDPRQPDTEVGPLRSHEDLACLQELLDDARGRGATVLCGGPVEIAHLSGSFFAPAVLRGVPAGARVLTEPVPGPVLALVEAGSEAEAIALASGDPSVSVWAGDSRHAERVARSLGAPLTWVNEHGVASPAAPVRLARHVEPRQLASQPTRLRSARWLPYDPALVRASTAVARLMHGRESERASALRHGAVPLVKTAVRLAREALGR
jgi:acyl-CoA reductase-like NAD-dependent aldehyde dehydrogenase